MSMTSSDTYPSSGTAAQRRHRLRLAGAAVTSGACATLLLTGLGSTPVNAAPAAVTAADGSPSGVPMPTAGDADWNLAYNDDFNGSAPSDAWSIYNGARAPQYWLKSHTIVNNGVLTLRTSKDSAVGGGWSSGALSRRGNQTYGKFLVRSRLDAGHGTRAVADLWPKGKWPPEVDFFEIGANQALRVRAYQTNHVAPNNHMIQTKNACTCTEWHTFGVEWTPSSLTYTMDGVVQNVVTESVPQVPMHLALQTSPGYGKEGSPDATTPANVDFDIDWIAVYTHS